MIATAPIVNNEQFFELCRRSPNIFAEYVVGLTQHPMHRRIQAHLTAHDDAYDEYPRGHGKTTQLSAVRVPWEIGNDPTLRVKYIMATEKDATLSTRLMKRIIASPRYQQVFPHITLDPADKSGGQFTVMADGDHATLQRDPTVQAQPIFGNAGGRVDLMVIDDACNLKNAVQQEALRDQVKEAYENTWQPTLVPGGREWKIGTCYHVDDITADWRRYHRGLKDGSLAREPVVGETSPCPEMFDGALLGKRRFKMGPIAYARAYELNPVSSEILIFDAAWLDDALYRDSKSSYDPGNVATRVAAIDWAFTEKKIDNDPDYSVMLIADITRERHIYVLDGMIVRKTYPAFVRDAIKMCERWGVQHVRAEGNGPQSGLVQQMNATAPFPVLPMGRGKDKISRAAEVQTQVESGRFHLRQSTIDNAPASGIMQEVYDQMTVFPAGGHDDAVDAAVDLCKMATMVGRPSRGQPGTDDRGRTRDRKRYKDPSRLY